CAAWLIHEDFSSNSGTSSTGVPMVADYPSLNLGQAVMVYCYQLATLIQQPAKSDTTADQHQLQALRERVMALLTTLAVADDIKLVDWLQQRLGLLEQRSVVLLGVRPLLACY
ncbi:tRNA/rRNA methyltransferase, partial [Escherichia sp. TWPC-MK]